LKSSGKTKRPGAAIEGLIGAASSAPALRELQKRLDNRRAMVRAEASPSSHAFLAAAISELLPGRSIALVSEELRSQERLQEEWETWTRGLSKRPAGPLYYPAWEVLPHEDRLPHADVVSERLETLAALLRCREEKKPALVNTTITALLQRTFPCGQFQNQARSLKRGDRIDPMELGTWLDASGYSTEVQVTQKGEWARRGGILDLFSLTSPWPARLEFFGNEIESIRLFDPVTQISREGIEEIAISPAGEFGALRKLAESNGAAALGSLFEYLPPDTIYLLRDPAGLERRAGLYAAQIPAGDPFFMSWAAAREAMRNSKGGVVSLSSSPESATPISELEGVEPPSPESADPEETAPVIEIDDLEMFRPLTSAVTEPEVALEQRRQFFGQLRLWMGQKYRVVVICATEGEKERLLELWTELGPADPAPTGSVKAAELTVEIGSLERGFLFPDARIVVASDAEIFGRLKARLPRRMKSPHAAATRSAFDINFSEFEEGDYVVHIEHGIGRYLGLKLLPVAQGQSGEGESAMEEFLAIEYAPRDPAAPPPRVYVPVTQAHLVGKYVGAGKANPPLNTLGGSRWAKAKEHAEHAVRDLAGEFLAIQAARASRPGHAFQADSAWQREFESAFPYQETVGQVRAIADTKRDMEEPRPMDRLICGDVGFGKTEVAIRAAFKAVMDGKQAALLAPTTVLAQQHFNTFRERMAEYPVTIEILSRFRTRREQAKAIAGLADGTVDIVIGTHRLLQGDVVFKDLGLVVIDEEQRFGVLHKEKFKRLRHMVDVLTLSATPIPRTLYMALSGARDLSTIDTPPQDRLPVETIVAPYDERLIRDAVQREMNRGGQVFYLHNRVFDILSVANRLQALLPKARIAVGHGQLDANELEETMTRFVNGEADVLLSTTIIESGLDIPNANTIIIDRADRFGLSDLYQLRGRVGRHKHQAYAYLLLPRHFGALTAARKRISALKQYSTLGSGFKIAMRDLEIRGAGNLLGSQQSGHITAVGFDLYCQLLKESIAGLKGEKSKPRVGVSIRIDFLALSPDDEQPETKGDRETKAGDSLPGLDSPAAAPARAVAYVPRSYIREAKERIEIYRKLAQVSDAAELERWRAEVTDRFGRPPAAIGLLWQVAELKLLAASRSVTSIETRGDRLMVTRRNDFIMVDGKFPRLTKATASARLKEIRVLLMALQDSAHGPAAQTHARN
jgi:transcription-repair coupling factor (superfamily II helicase)